MTAVAVKQGTWDQNKTIFTTPVGIYRRVQVAALDAENRVVRIYQHGFDTPNGSLLLDADKTSETIVKDVEEHYANLVQSCFEKDVKCDEPLDDRIEAALASKARKGKT